MRDTIGQTPHIMAKLAIGAEPIRITLSPTATITAPAFSVPTPSSSSRLGASSSTKGTMNRSSSAISSLMSRISAGVVGLQGELGRDHRVSIADRVRPPGRTGTQALHAGEVADLVTHFLRCGNDGVVELLQGREAARLPAFALFAAPAGLPRCRNGGLSPPGPGVLCAPRPRPHSCIQGVGLALGSSAGWVRPGHLEARGYPRLRRCRVMPAP